MVISLRWRLVWPVALYVTCMTATLGVGLGMHRSFMERTVRMNDTRDHVEGQIELLVGRHRRTTNRARAALAGEATDGVSVLRRTSENYLREVGREVARVDTAILTLSPDRPDPRLTLDRNRLRKAVARIRMATQQVGAALDLVLGGAVVQDVEEMESAQRKLVEADLAFVAEVERFRALFRRAMSLQARYLMGHTLWWNIVVVVAVSFALGLMGLVWRTVGGFELLAASPFAQRSARSSEEGALRAHFADARVAHDLLQGQLEQRIGDMDKAAQALRRGVQELALFKIYNENLVNSLRAAIVVTDRSGRVTNFNRVARTMLGFSASCKGQPIEGTLLYRVAVARDPRLVDLFATEESPKNRGARLEEIPCEDRFLDLAIVPYLDEGGAVRGFLWVADDISEAVRTKNQLLRAEHLAAVGRLSAQVAHEIRNPLSAIGLNAELLEEELGDVSKGSEAHELLRGIASEIERLSQITQGYLELARMPTPKCQMGDLNQLVGETFNMLAKELKASGIDVTLEFGRPVPQVWADPGQLRQAILNVVGNSREAMPNGGQLLVRTHALDSQSQLTVIDTGYGIDTDSIHRVFEPFFTTKAEGTGLGLSLTQQILADHGGHIDIQANQPSGVLVTLTIPNTPPNA